MHISSPAAPSRTALREAIADALWQASALELADICVSFGLDPQRPDEADPMASKRSYVKRRLVTQSSEDLYALARTVHTEYPTDALAALVGSPGYRGVDGELKNLIFAANGPKPKIVFTDALNNTIDIVENAEYCLVYDRPLGEGGLTWRELVAWWTREHDQNAASEVVAARALYNRLCASMGDNPVEQFVFAQYCRRGLDQPALIPQVYLHYDPYTRRSGAPLARQRMDFLMLLPQRRRVVLEVDGVQHYADAGGCADTRRYAEMVRADRELKLAGYEVYRFGGYELAKQDTHSASMLAAFFDALL